MNQLETPVLLCAYRRPSTTYKVFDAIRQARPKQLFVSVNAPNPQRPEEKKKCDEVKQIVEAIDWPCDLKTLFRDEHLPLKESISGAINWFFDHVEEGIILEDDCLPSQDFFSFCQHLLSHYRNDSRVMHISGCNHGINDDRYSYYFSQHIHIWGWATWREAWSEYNPNIEGWTKFKEIYDLVEIFGSETEKNRRMLNWDKAFSGEIDCWDYQWSYSVISQNGLSVIPSKNLIENIGFGAEATHTKSVSSYHSQLRHEKLTFPLSHPEHRVVRRDLDEVYNNRNQISSRSIPQKLRSKLRYLLNLMKGGMRA